MINEEHHLYTAHIIVTDKISKLFDELYNILYNYDIRNPVIKLVYNTTKPKVPSVQPILTAKLNITHSGRVINDTIKTIILGELHNYIYSFDVLLNK